MYGNPDTGLASLEFGSNMNVPQDLSETVGQKDGPVLAQTVLNSDFAFLILPRVLEVPVSTIAALALQK
jgi:hypothetical protein